MMDGQRVGQRNEIRGFFHRADTGQAGYTKDITLDDVTIQNRGQKVGAQRDGGFGPGFAVGHVLAGDIDHVGPAFAVEMVERPFIFYRQLESSSAASQRTRVMRFTSCTEPLSSL